MRLTVDENFQKQDDFYEKSKVLDSQQKEALYSTPRKNGNIKIEPKIPQTKEEKIALEIEALNAYIEEDIRNFELITSGASELEDQMVEQNPFSDVECGKKGNRTSESTMNFNDHTR